MADDRPIDLGEQRARVLVQLDAAGLRREIDVVVAEVVAENETETDATPRTDEATLAHVRRVAASSGARPRRGARRVIFRHARALETGNSGALAAELALIRGALLAGTPPCTGIAASWCPNCGDCSCERTEDGERLAAGLFVADTGERLEVSHLEVTWPEGGTHIYLPPEAAPETVLRSLGLEWRAIGTSGCPLHAPDSSHAMDSGSRD